MDYGFGVCFDSFGAVGFGISTTGVFYGLSLSNNRKLKS